MSTSRADAEGATAGDEAFAGPGTTPSRTSTSPIDFDSEWVAQTVVLRRVAGTPSVSLAWTASPSSWATGYRLERVVGGTVQSTRTVSPTGTSVTTEGPLVSGTAYTFRLRAYRGTWTSSEATTTTTPTC